MPGGWVEQRELGGHQVYSGRWICTFEMLNIDAHHCISSPVHLSIFEGSSVLKRLEMIQRKMSRVVL
jgi:hypothetical protein